MTIVSPPVSVFSYSVYLYLLLGGVRSEQKTKYVMEPISNVWWSRHSQLRTMCHEGGFETVVGTQNLDFRVVWTIQWPWSLHNLLVFLPQFVHEQRQQQLHYCILYGQGRNIIDCECADEENKTGDLTGDTGARYMSWLPLSENHDVHLKQINRLTRIWIWKYGVLHVSLDFKLSNSNRGRREAPPCIIMEHAPEI